MKDRLNRRRLARRLRAGRSRDSLLARQAGLLGGVLSGAVLFGIGMAILGYCPGTSVAACGEGRRDAMVGVLGMLVGAGAYVALYPSLRPLIHSLADWGKITIPEVLGVSPWLIVAALLIAGGVVLWIIQRRPHRRGPVSPPATGATAGRPTH